MNKVLLLWQQASATLADSQDATGYGKRVRSSSVEKKNVADSVTATPETCGGVTLKKFNLSGISFTSVNPIAQKSQSATQKPEIIHQTPASILA